MPNGKLERYDLNRIAFQAAGTFQSGESDNSDFYTWLMSIAQHKCIHCNQDHSSMCCPSERCYSCNKFGHWDYICPDPEYAVENPYYKALDYAAEVAALDEKEWLECNLVSNKRNYKSNTVSPNQSPKHYNSDADEYNSDTEYNSDDQAIESVVYATKFTKCQITVWFA
jgi:hypothetical protein